MDVAVFAVDSLATMFLLPFRSGQNEPATPCFTLAFATRGNRQRSRIVELSNGSLLNRTGKLYTSADGLRSSVTRHAAGTVRHGGRAPGARPIRAESPSQTRCRLPDSWRTVAADVPVPACRAARPMTCTDPQDGLELRGGTAGHEHFRGQS